MRVAIRILIIVVAGVAGAWAGHIYWKSADPESARIPSAEEQAANLIKAEFALTGQDGRPVGHEDFRGRWMLVFFGFTYCPDICPSTLATVSTALDELGPLADSVQPVFITVDPERDTVEVLADYMEAFRPGIAALTGTPEEIAATAANFRVFYAKVDAGDGSDDYLMDHSAFLYLVDPEGKFDAPLTHQSTIPEIVEALQRRLSAGS